MSSRLIILPKKSYCPWKPENVQRVLRDQEQHRREAEHATQAEERRGRREALSHQQQERRNGGEANDEAGGVAGSVRHINLFEAEEKVERARLTEHERRMLQEDSAPTARPPPTDREVGRARGPFYLKENPYSSTSATLQQRSEAFVAREERRKAELDPMAAYSAPDKRRRTDDDGAGASVENPPTSTALVVQSRTNRREKGASRGDDGDDVGSTSSESESDKRRRKKGKKRKRKKKHRRSSEERERRRGTSEKK